MEITLKINTVQELDKFLCSPCSKQSNSFYESVFDFLCNYNVTGINRQAYEDCIWNFIRHINFYKLDNICYKLYEYVTKDNVEDNDNKDNKNTFIDYLQEEYYYDGENDFNTKDNDYISNYIFEKFLELSFKNNNFDLVSDMINCDNENVFVNNLDKIIKNKQYDLLESICNNIDDDTFKTIFNMLIKYDIDDTCRLALSLYKKRIDIYN